MEEQMGQSSQIVSPYRAPSEPTMGKSVPFGQNSFLKKKEMKQAQNTAKGTNGPSGVKCF